MDMQSVEHEALGLSTEERARLALDLIESLEVLPPIEVDQLWTREAERRAAHIQAGAVELVPGNTVSGRAHALLR